MALNPPPIQNKFEDQTSPQGIFSRTWILWFQSIANRFSFTNLNDTPDGYSGEAGKVAAVNGTEDGLEFITVGSGGFTPTIFQALKNGTQVTTGTMADITGWTETVSSADITFNTTTGVVTFDTAGTYLITIHVVGFQSVGDNRTQLETKMQLDTGSGFADVAGAFDSQYAARNLTQDNGSAQINNFALAVSSTDDVKFQMRDVGTEVDVLSDRARISILRVV